MQVKTIRAIARAYNAGFKDGMAAVQAERDAALARIATLEQQLTDAAGRINELEAPAPPPVRQWDPVQPARKKYEAPEYQPLPEGCEIGDGHYQLAVGEVLQEGDEWCLEPNQWRATLCYGGAVPEGYIYRRKQ